MAFHPIRPVENSDYETLKPRLESFMKRHNITPLLDYPEQDAKTYVKNIMFEIESSLTYNKKHLMRNYEAIIARATKCPDATGLAWGYVGYSSKN